MSESNQPTNTPDKSERLAKLEAAITQHSFVDRGTALAAIRDEVLYKPAFPSFEEYCASKWGFKRAHAYRLIEAAEIAKEASPFGDITKETHARALGKVAKDKRQAVLQAALAKAASAGRNLSAKDIAEAAYPQAVTVTPESGSVEKNLRALWTQASAAEGASFRRWIELMDAAVVPAKPAEPTEENQASYSATHVVKPSKTIRRRSPFTNATNATRSSATIHSITSVPAASGARPARPRCEDL